MGEISIDPSAFDWDEEKSLANLRKHGISFREAREVFFDPNTIYDNERIQDDELRIWATGRLLNQAIVVVVHVWRDKNGKDVIRIISARTATPRERGRYVEQAFGGRTTESS